MVQEMIDFLTASDPEIGASVAAELARQRRNIELIASENIVSEAVLVAMGTVLTNKYAEGYPGKRWRRTSPAIGPASSSAPTTPMYSPTPAPRPTLPSIRPCVSTATPCWAWIWATADT